MASVKINAARAAVLGGNGAMRSSSSPYPTRIEVSASTGPLFCSLASGSGRAPALRDPLSHPPLAAIGVADHLEAAGVEEAARAGPRCERRPRYALGRQRLLCAQQGRLRCVYRTTRSPVGEGSVGNPDQSREKPYFPPSVPESGGVYGLSLRVALNGIRE